eukprot:3701289-Amphidinium_carterae.1
MEVLEPSPMCGCKAEDVKSERAFLALLRRCVTSAVGLGFELRMDPRYGKRCVRVSVLPSGRGRCNWCPAVGK